MNKAQKLYEIAKCLKDPIYGIETYLETEDRTQGGYVPFKLFPRQKELINGYVNSHHNIVMKPRQAGISTTTAAFVAILTALSSKKSPEKVLIAANKQETAKEFLKKIKDFTMQLPGWMDVYRPKDAEGWFDNEKNSNSHYRLWNGSEVKAVASSKDALRGYTPSLIIIDEAAFIEGNKGEEFYSAAQPSLSTGGRSILISCVTEDTFVYTNNGIKQVSEFIDKTKKGGYHVDTYSILGYGKQRQSNIMYNNGLHDTKIIETKFSKIEGSLNHKLYAYSEKHNTFGWYRLEDLHEGDYVPIVYNNNVWGSNDDCLDFQPKKNNRNRNVFRPKKITKNIAYFMGLFLAEGSSYKIIKDGKHVGTSITISCGDDVSDIFNKLGLSFSYDGKWHYTTGSKELGEFLEYVGFDLSLKAAEKTIPKRIFSLSKENIIAFIRGFMDGDGYSREDNGRVGLCSASKTMVEQFRILFMNLGILCEYQEILQKPTKKVLVESMNYRLHMNTKFSKLYYDLVGFGFERKQLKKQSLIKHRENDPRDVIPCGAEIIKETYQKQKSNKRGLKYFKDRGCDISHITKKNSKVNHISRGLMLSYLDIINENYNNISENIHWVKIKKIKNSKNYTYDFSLPNIEDDLWCHSILYNGILGHQTPNGYDPLYHKTYKLAKEGKNNFNVVEMKWYEDPRYNKNLKWLFKTIVDGDEQVEEKIENDKTKWDELIKEGWEPTSPWFEDMCAQLNHNSRMIAQELLCSFLGSGDQVIDDKHVQRHKREYESDPIRKEWLDGQMWVWEDPIKDHRYILAADAASGSADDFASIWILDFDTGYQVAEYHGKVSPDVLGEIAHYYGESYDAFIVVDITGGYGISTVLKLLELGYPNKKLYYDNVIGIDAIENNKSLEKYMRNGKLPGLNFQNKRTTIITEMEKSVRMDTIKIRSVRTLNEMPTFVFINNRPNHMKGYHDDLLMGMAMCNFVGMTSFKDLEKSKGQVKAMVESWSSIETSTQENEELDKVVGVDFYVNGGVPKDEQSLEKTQEYMWMFSGMPGFKKRR